MRKMFTIAVLLIPAPAMACHHYSKWYYPWKQSCAPELVALETKTIPMPPTPPPRSLQDYIPELNILLKKNDPDAFFIIDIPIDDLFKTDRDFAIDEIRKKLK